MTTHSSIRLESAAQVAAVRPARAAPERSRDVQSSGPVSRTEAEPTLQDLQGLADEVAASTPRPVSISIHEETGRFVVEVRDEAGEILRQFPSKSALGLAAKLRDLKGILFEGSAA